MTKLIAGHKFFPKRKKRKQIIHPSVVAGFACYS